jgi:uncharacterized damage-inducible protein DinB
MGQGIQIWREAIWEQLGGSLAMLERAIGACPEAVWTEKAGTREFWYVVYHTLFFVDLYLSGTTEGFAPPAPFTRSELNPLGIRPERQYTKAELLEYVRHCREKGRVTMESLTDLQAERVVEFKWLRMRFGELMLYNMRHVQHHTGQLNMLLRQSGIEPPDWFDRATPYE